MTQPGVEDTQSRSFGWVLEGCRLPARLLMLLPLLHIIIFGWFLQDTSLKIYRDFRALVFDFCMWK